MKSLFNLFTSLSLRFRAITLLLVVAVIGLGAVAWTQLKQELLPPIEFPSTIILGQFSGVTSDEVLAVLTGPLEHELASIPDVVNIESTTTGAFGAVLTVSNEFGLSQARLHSQIQDAIDRVWLPLRHIPATGYNQLYPAGPMIPIILHRNEEPSEKEGAGMSGDILS